MDMPNDYEGPPTVAVICECGYEGNVCFDLHGRIEGDDEPYWTSHCPKCHEALGSELMEECDGCHVFGGDHYPVGRQSLCESCHVNETGLDPLKL